MHEKTRLSRTVWWGTAIVALCFVVIVGITAFEDHQRTLREATRNAQNSVALLSEQLEGLISSTQMLLAIIERRGLSEAGALGSRAVDVSGALDEMPDFISGGLFTARGLVKPVISNAAAPDIPQEVVDDLMVGVSSGADVWVTKPFSAGKELFVLLGRRPRSLAASDLGIAVGVVMPLARLRKLVAEPDVGATGLVGLLRSDGILLARAPMDQVSAGRRMPQFRVFRWRDAASAEGSYETVFSSDGIRRLASYRRLEGVPLVVTVAPGRHEALSSWRRDLFREGLLLFATLIVVCTAGMLISRVSRRREEAEADLSEKSAVLEATLNHMDQGLILIDSSHHVPLYNRRALELLDLPEALLARRPHGDEITAFQRGRGEFEALPPELYAKLLHKPLEMGRFAFERERPDGSVIEVRCVPLPGGGAVRTYTDITERKRAEREIIRLAHKDALTGLANRASFLASLTRACADLDNEGVPFALLCLDLDRFKHVNDTLGHPTGDALLREVARRLSGLVGPDNVAARLGGDEFALLLFDCCEQAQLDAFAERVVTSLNAPYLLDGAAADVSVSGGTAIAPGDGSDPDALLRRADLALYEAKSAGRCMVRAFVPVMEQKTQRRRLLLRDLAEALPRRELRLDYQPIFGIEDRRVHSLEALIRWDHPARGPVSPDDFIPLAEESELIDRIGEWVLGEACGEAASWSGKESVAVNISAMQFARQGLVDAVRDSLAGSGLAPGRLHLEITETALLRETSETIDTLEKLRALGVHISLDDFGTGYSSLSHLCSFPFDRIKIDRSFTRGAPDDRSSRAVVDAVAALGQELGIQTTAEGVETEEQLAIVRDAGCNEVQGYLYARPLGPEQLRTFLAERAERAA